MLLHVFVFIVSILNTAETPITFTKCIGFERTETLYEYPLTDVEFALTIQQQWKLDVFLNNFAESKLD